MIIDYFLCSIELEICEISGVDMLIEGFIGVVSDNGEKLEKVSVGFFNFSEFVIRGEDVIIEFKEIEEFECEDNIDLFMECVGYLVLVMGDLGDVIFEIFCKIEDIEINEGDF